MTVNSKKVLIIMLLKIILFISIYFIVRRVIIKLLLDKVLSCEKNSRVKKKN